MTLVQAAVLFAIQLMNKTNHHLPYDKDLVINTVEQISVVTDKPQELETLIRIARWESGGFDKNVITCKRKGDHGLAHGLFQVHPWNAQEAKDACADVTVQAKLALRRVKESVRMCKRAGKKGSDLLTGYTVGHCISNGKQAALRWGTGKKIKLILEN